MYADYESPFQPHIPLPMAILVFPCERCDVLVGAGMLGSEGCVSVDITCSQDGLHKAKEFREHVHTRPLVFAAVLILTTWARLVGLIRSSGSSDVGSTCAMCSGDWQALLLHILTVKEVRQKV